MIVDSFANTDFILSLFNFLNLLWFYTQLKMILRHLNIFFYYVQFGLSIEGALLLDLKYSQSIYSVFQFPYTVNRYSDHDFHTLFNFIQVLNLEILVQSVLVCIVSSYSSFSTFSGFENSNL